MIGDKIWNDGPTIGEKSLKICCTISSLSVIDKESESLNKLGSRTASCVKIDYSLIENRRQKIRTCRCVFDRCSPYQ